MLTLPPPLLSSLLGGRGSPLSSGRRREGSCRNVEEGEGGSLRWREKKPRLRLCGGEEQAQSPDTCQVIHCTCFPCALCQCSVCTVLCCLWPFGPWEKVDLSRVRPQQRWLLAQGSAIPTGRRLCAGQAPLPPAGWLPGPRKGSPLVQGSPYLSLFPTQGPEPPTRTGSFPGLFFS